MAANSVSLMHICLTKLSIFGTSQAKTDIEALLVHFSDPPYTHTDQFEIEEHLSLKGCAGERGELLDLCTS